MKVDLKGTTFLFHVRLDTEEREKNVSIITNFYRKNCTNFNFIFVEDDSIQKLPDVIEFTEDDTYVFSRNSGIWNKCKSFNKGIILAKSDILIFHDLDAILQPSQLLTTIDTLLKNPEYGLMYPYNGLFLCVKKEIKEEFSKSLDYATLDNFFPKNLSVPAIAFWASASFACASVSAACALAVNASALACAILTSSVACALASAIVLAASADAFSNAACESAAF